MLSKGVNYYFVNTSELAMSSQALNADGSISMNQTDIQNQPAYFCTGNCQIEASVLPPAATGSITVNAGGTTLNESINAITGTSSGPLSNMMQTNAVITDNYNLSYGFFDAGTGVGTGLTNQDQIYGYLTPPQQNWMGNLASQNASVNNAPFANFVLPGAHDSGTFDLTAVNAICSNPISLAALITILGPVFGSLIANDAPSVITGVAVTQKDNITSMLNLGCRYFDFRPGMMPTPINQIASDIYHIHTIIPGYPFSSFLMDILTWLNNNPSEIVVISLGGSGFLDVTIPTINELQSILIEAQQNTKTQSIQIGSTSDLQTVYADLISQNKRLFFLNTQDGAFGDWYPARKYDSYNDSYNTTNPENIITALQAMNTGGQANADFTVLQLQGTATGQNVGAIITSLIASSSNAYEPLISTKANFDSNTYPWLLNNVSTNLSNNQLLVMLNDFVDNGLATVASSLTLERCNS
jgi:hypothetical protein